MPPPCLQIVFRGYTSNSSNSNNKIESAVQPIGTNRFLLLTGAFIMIICVLCRPVLYLSSCERFSYIDKYRFYDRICSEPQYTSIVNDDNDDIRISR